MIDKRDDDFLGQNIKGMMMTLLAHWNAQMDDARSETEFATIRPADMRVFGQLRGRAVKLSMIHREMGFSRQAAQQAVDRLVEHEMISVQPDPDSKRDKIVTITEKGQRWRSIAAAQIRLIEGQIAESLGEEAKERLRHALIDLMRATR
ncbi:MAG: MarR family transcriptional regulator [Pseudomonadota bacterium]